MTSDERVEAIRAILDDGGVWWDKLSTESLMGLLDAYDEQRARAECAERERDEALMTVEGTASLLRAALLTLAPLTAPGHDERNDHE